MMWPSSSQRASHVRGAGATLSSLTMDHPLVQPFTVHDKDHILQEVRKIFFPPNPQTVVVCLSTILDTIPVQSVLEVLPPPVRRSMLVSPSRLINRSGPTHVTHVYSHELRVR